MPPAQLQYVTFLQNSATMIRRSASGSGVGVGFTQHHQMQNMNMLCSVIREIESSGDKAQAHKRAHQKAHLKTSQETPGRDMSCVTVLHEDEVDKVPNFTIVPRESPCLVLVNFLEDSMDHLVDILVVPLFQKLHNALCMCLVVEMPLAVESRDLRNLLPLLADSLDACTGGYHLGDRLQM